MDRHTLEAVALTSTDAHEVQAYASRARNIRKTRFCVVSADTLAEIAERLFELEEELNEKDAEIEELKEAAVAE